LTVELEATRDLAAKGQFAEAEKHATAALALDPENLTALLFLARTVKGQVQKDATPENRALAERAIDLYGRVLKRLPNNLEAFQAVAAIYANIGDQANRREWFLNLAQNGSFPNAVRVPYYRSLVGDSVACTETAMHTLFSRPRGDVPKGQPRTTDTSVVDDAIACGNQGLEFTDAMSILSPEDAAWRERVKLLRALVNLTGKAGRTAESQSYQTQLGEAEKRATMEDPIRAAGFLPPAQVDARQVINGSVIAMPLVTYPAAARAANAQGAVYLNVTTDAEGFVIAAELFSGHPLLRAAALNIAIWARFDTSKMKTRNGVLAIEFKSDEPGPPAIANPPAGTERRDPRKPWPH
jgi:tetratricopeptide (TPR) repeat protein